MRCPVRLKDSRRVNRFQDRVYESVLAQRLLSKSCYEKMSQRSNFFRIIVHMTADSWVLILLDASRKTPRNSAREGLILAAPHPCVTTAKNPVGVSHMMTADHKKLKHQPRHIPGRIRFQHLRVFRWESFVARIMKENSCCNDYIRKVQRIVIPLESFRQSCVCFFLFFHSHDG